MTVLSRRATKYKSSFGKMLEDMPSPNAGHRPASVSTEGQERFELCHGIIWLEGGESGGNTDIIKLEVVEIKFVFVEDLKSYIKAERTFEPRRGVPHETSER